AAAAGVHALSKRTLGRFDVAERLLDLGPLEVGVAVVGVALQYLVEVRDSRRRLPGLLVLHRQAVEQERVVGLALEHLLQLPHPWRLRRREVVRSFAHPSGDSIQQRWERGTDAI